MPEVSADELRQAVEHLHACRAVFQEVVPVTEIFQDQIAWDGIVHVFALEGHPTATKCFAWSSEVEGSDRRKFYAVLAVHPIATPHEAIRAATVHDYKAN